MSTDPTTADREYTVEENIYYSAILVAVLGVFAGFTIYGGLGLGIGVTSLAIFTVLATNPPARRKHGQ